MPNWASLEAHERMRWDTMDRRQLQTRLRRITKPEKLALFMRTALSREEISLYREAQTRAEMLGLATNQHITRVSSQWMDRYENRITQHQAVAQTRRVPDTVVAVRKVRKRKPEVRKIRFRKKRR